MISMTSIENSINISSFSPVVFFHKMLVSRRDGLSLLENEMETCIIKGCTNKYCCKGYCRMHYTRLLRHGNPLFTKKGRDQEKHGKRHTSEYMVWADMIQRCYNKKGIGYKYYGGRGIIVCDRWRNSFIAFFEDMGKKPFSKAQIDRIDNNGDYEPGNCHWVATAENMRNRSSTKLTWAIVNKIRKLYKLGGITHKGLGIIYGIHRTTVGQIINYRRWR